MNGSLLALCLTVAVASLGHVSEARPNEYTFSMWSDEIIGYVNEHAKTWTVIPNCFLISRG
jgi:hypothetical protein